MPEGDLQPEAAHTDRNSRRQSSTLLFDSRHEDFPGKLHTRSMGPFYVCKVYSNGSLQLADLGRNPQDTRVNGSRVNLYKPEGVCKDAHG